ncbi:MAG: hypothetical protein HRU28_02480 [Rhizobiales bacterium]|nr:hypothetical protein [Hyphomicrobiales bacterium]
MNLTKQIQLALILKGFKCGNPDGIMGALTENAIIEFKISVGLKARAYVGPITLKKLGIVRQSKTNDLIPWLNEMSKQMGLTEFDSALKKWLRSDGGTVGNPEDIAWCGDAMHTSIRNSMPNEIFTGRVKQNPYLAKNWLEFGNETKPLYGAIIILWRKSKRSMYGHIANVIGYDPVKKRYRIRGGNQSNMVCDTWVDAHRVRGHGFRVPKTFVGTLPPLPIMNSRGAVISTNEA